MMLALKPEKPTKKVLPNRTAKPICNTGETPSPRSPSKFLLLRKLFLPTLSSTHPLGKAACGMSDLS